MNRAECRLLGYARENIVGRPVWAFVSAGEQERVRISVFEKLVGRLPLERVEREYTSASGKRLVFEVHENAIFDSAGAITGIRTAMLDITEQKQREQEAQVLAQERAAREQAEATSAEIRSILERIGDAYIAFDAEWRYTYVNRRAAELALKPASELLGRCVWDEFPEAVHTTFYIGASTRDARADPGRIRELLRTSRKIFRKFRLPQSSGVGVFYRDITERVRSQRALEKGTRELALKNAELETFASVASHDLQEPLRMIGGYASLLNRRYADVLDGDAAEFLAFMTQGVDRMQRLVRICWRSAVWRKRILQACRRSTCRHLRRCREHVGTHHR